jgi:diguanylate cyclase (GGDEF)-like protein/hemerythrin-like metal-binding protein/PAS domain S-box-containing protein
MTKVCELPSAPASGSTEILLALPFPVCAADAATGSLVLVNGAFTRLTGRSKDEAPTLASLGALIGPAPGEPAGASSWNDWLARGAAGTVPGPIVTHLLHKDGTPLHVRTHMSQAGNLHVLSLEDLTEQSELPTELRQTGLGYQSLVEQALVGIFVLREDKLSYVNPQFAHLLGYEIDHLAGQRTLAQLAAAEDAATVDRRLRLLRESPDQDACFVFAAVRGDGAVIDVEVVARMVSPSKDPLILGAVTDVTDSVRAERQLEYLAFHDVITGLPNRALFFDRLNQAIKRARRYERGFGLMMLDLDGFKKINDALGHDAGDTVLRIVAQRLSGCVRKSDTVARVGGDEFALVLHETCERPALARLAERLVKAAGETIDFGGTTSRVGASVGVVLYPDHGATIDVLMARADAAMYAGKQTGTSGYTFFQPGVHRESAQDNALIRWSPDHELGIAVIDQQHRRLSEMVNGLARAIAEADDTARVRALVDDLRRFTAHHFDTEEGLMDRYQITNSRSHKEHHRKLQDELAAIQRQIGSSELSRTHSAIRAWLLAHIQNADRELVRQLRSQGVR